MRLDSLHRLWPPLIGYFLFSLLMAAPNASCITLEVSPQAGEKDSIAASAESHKTSLSVGLSAQQAGTTLWASAYKSSEEITEPSQELPVRSFLNTGSAAHPIAVLTSFASMLDPTVPDSRSTALSIPLLEIAALGGALTLSTGFDTHMDDAILGYQKGWTSSLLYEHHLFVGGLTGYIEFYSDNDFYNDSLWVGILGLGVVYSPEENFHITAGLELGLTEDVSGLSPFMGLSIPF